MKRYRISRDYYGLVEVEVPGDKWVRFRDTQKEIKALRSEYDEWKLRAEMMQDFMSCASDWEDFLEIHPEAAEWFEA
jgi:hypothetical protein